MEKTDEQALLALSNKVKPSATPKTDIPVAIATPIQNFPIDLQNDQKRRSSSRSIKRKRFDDEIVEYSPTSTQSRGDTSRVGRPRTTSQTYTPSPLAAPPPPLPTTSAGTSAEITAPLPLSPIHSVTTSSPVPIPTTTSTSTLTSTSTSTSTSVQMHPIKLLHTPIVMDCPTSSLPERRRPGRSGNKRSRRSGRPSGQVTTKDLGRWKPIDDLALIIGIQQTNDLRMIHRGIKFSCRFTLQELQARWFSLLYEPSISRIAVAAMRNLHPETIESVKRKALYSVQEEELLGTIKSTDNPKLEQFQELLEKNASIFYTARSAKTLQNHWQLMKHYQLLPDQVIQPLHNSDSPMSFSDAEDLILDAELNDPRDELLEIELTLADRQQKREIRLIENELSRWNVLVDSITGAIISQEFDSQTLAVLRGRLVRYLMRSKEITFGREAKDSTVDVDLSLEGPALKISRRQGTIKLRSNGDFFIANEGKRSLFINGVPLLPGSKTRLANNCMVEICSLRFLFLVNYELINAIRYESAKTTTALN